MIFKAIITFLSIPLLFSCSPTSNREENSLTYIMDMVHKNPGEAHQKSKYYDPEYLKEVGYNSIVPQFHVQCALTFDNFEDGIIPEGSKEREWILDKQKEIKDVIKKSKAAGLKIYPFTDMFVLPTMILEKYKNELVNRDELDLGNSSTNGKLPPDIEKDLTVTLLKAQLEEIFETFPELDGLVIRFGETYLYDTPYHSGSSPARGKGDKLVAGQVKLINILRDEVCEKYNKKIFYRTWDFGFFHTNPEVYKTITDQIEPHDNLLFSIKYSRGDFHRLTQFNPCLGIGKHPYIIEFQAQPEYYGKCAHPVYVFGGVLNGFSEYSRNMQPDQIQSVAELKGDPKFKGLWTWSRGGGWKGPYIEHELWCDVNAHTAVAWARDTTLTESQALDNSLTGLGVKESSLADFKEMLKITDVAVLKGQCTNLELPFNIWWSRDQYFYKGNSQDGFFSAAVKQKRGRDVIKEKDEAVALWENIVELSKKIEMNDPDDKKYLEISAQYGLIKHDVIRQIFIVCLNLKENEINNSFDKVAVERAIKKYDQLWKEWEELKDDNPSCATIYQPYGFALTLEKGAYGNPGNGIMQTIDTARELVN